MRQIVDSGVILNFFMTNLRQDYVPRVIMVMMGYASKMGNFLLYWCVQVHMYTVFQRMWLTWNDSIRLRTFSFVQFSKNIYTMTSKYIYMLMDFIGL